MPTYSYRCTECGHAFDIQQAFTDDSLTVCPSCGGNLRKLFSAVGVTFNGSGFYRNDSRAAAEVVGSSSTVVQLVRVQARPPPHPPRPAPPPQHPSKPKMKEPACSRDSGSSSSAAM